MTGRYKAYPEYKDSGVEWFEYIPRNWLVSRLKFSSLINMGQSPNSDDCNIDGVGLAFLQGNAEFGDKHPTEKQFCPVSKKVAKTGELLFSVRAPVGALNIADKDYGIGRGLCSIKNKFNVAPQFLWWLLPAYKNQFDAVSTGSTFEAVSAEQVGNLAFGLPSHDEQQKIANFLDHETAKIDTLITKQEKLIELLKEKRQTVISHAVTKGLNPDAPMKDSGVEWLGEVPEHWGVASIRRFLLEHRQGYYTTEPYIDDGVKLLRITDLRDLGEVSTDNCPKVPEHSALSNYYLKEGDVVFARTGGAGSFGVIPKISETVAYASYLIRFRFIPEHFNTDYQRFMLIADSFQFAVKSNIHGGVNQNIHAEDIKDTFVCCPPLKEQQNILKFLNDKCVNYNLLIDKAVSAIELMVERKTALISAAVTGKVDVRHFTLKEGETS